ncbi:MAG: transglutaminase domain-containing protein [Sedimentisphaerales bacterium]|nr:transglutaminase domain-containing protein [Sedimentisphaerales bacterium]
MKQVYIADDPTEAHLVKGILEQYGISCEIRGEALWIARGQLPLTSETLPTIWIADDNRYEEATELAERFKDGTLTEKSGANWKCSECGEEVEGQFTECWQCGANRPEETQIYESWAGGAVEEVTPVLSGKPVLEEYLRSTEVIDWQHTDIISKAKEFAVGEEKSIDVARSCFEWVRDEIKHIGDHDIQTVACSASEVLRAGSGICYAKSHLLAALLRANCIPAGFCYQRLSRDDDGMSFCLHGLNAVYLEEYGWYRIDARGNREGVDAQFTPPKERLAFRIQIEGEKDLPEIWAEPLEVIVKILRKYKTKDQLWNNLPDIQII